eukprot:3939889-Rhodomonas_salina.2
MIIGESELSCPSQHGCRSHLTLENVVDGLIVFVARTWDCWMTAMLSSRVASATASSASSLWLHASSCEKERINLRAESLEGRGVES